MTDKLAYNYIKEKYYDYLYEIKNNNSINHNIKKLDIYKDYVKKLGKRIKKTEFEEIMNILINDVISNYHKINNEINFDKNINVPTNKTIKNINVIGYQTMKEIGEEINKYVEEKQIEREKNENNLQQHKKSLIEKIKFWWKNLFIVQFFQYKKITKDIDEIIKISID